MNTPTGHQAKPKPKHIVTRGILIILLVGLIVGGGTAALFVFLNPREMESSVARGIFGDPTQSKAPAPKSQVEPVRAEEKYQPLVMAVAPHPKKQGASRNQPISEKNPAEEETAVTDPATNPLYANLTGNLDPNEVKRIINTHTMEVRSCYEKRLKTNNGLQGVIDVFIVIGTTGNVQKVDFTRDTVRDGEVRRCVARKVMSWKFPKPVGGRVGIQSPFRFTPQGG